MSIFCKIGVHVLQGVSVLEGGMKKVTLIFPDKILRTIGSTRLSRTDEIELTPENLKLVLCDDSDYHDRFKFKLEDVEIVKIENLVP
jgi:hypothetical protein